ncbi:MAG: hypothetical protein AB1540_05470 [Bdellovibrionota bacterium]
MVYQKTFKRACIGWATLCFVLVFSHVPSPSWAADPKDKQLQPPLVTSLVIPEKDQEILFDSKTMELVRKGGYALPAKPSKDEMQSMIERVVSKFDSKNLTLTSEQEAVAYQAFRAFRDFNARVDWGLYHMPTTGIPAGVVGLISSLLGLEHELVSSLTIGAGAVGGAVGRFLYKRAITNGVSELSHALENEGISVEELVRFNADAFAKFLWFSQMKMTHQTSIRYFADQLKYLEMIKKGEKGTFLLEPDQAFTELVEAKYRFIADMKKISSELGEMNLAALNEAYQREWNEEPPLDLIESDAREKSTKANLYRTTQILNNFGIQAFDPRLVDLLRFVEKAKAEYKIDVNIEHVAGHTWKLYGELTAIGSFGKLQEKAVVFFHDYYGHTRDGKMTSSEIINDFQRELGTAAEKLLHSMKTHQKCTGLLEK